MNKSIKLYFKTAAITLLCFVLIIAFAAGTIVADNKISKTMGTQLNSVEYNDSSQNILVSLFGNEYIIDTSFATVAANKASEFSAVISPEIRLFFTSLTDFSDYVFNLIFSKTQA